MQDLADATSVSRPDALPLPLQLRALGRRILAGNPFYLASAGLLLYGINRLTTDPRLVGAEFSMLRFNFCALAVYEVMLVVTAIALARRRIWYDALLLVGLTNVFIIVPFSLISRAVYLSPELALVMCSLGALLAAGKFSAFKHYLPELNLPARLLSFGAALLLLNAAAPLLFKAIADQPARIAEWLNVAWTIVLPLLAGLGCLLPKQTDCGDAPGQQRWVPPAFFLGWILVTACHLGGIGYAASFDWNLALLVPVLWVVAWTLHLRRTDFARETCHRVDLIWLSLPLCVPLLGIGSARVLPVFALLNLAVYGWRFVSSDHGRVALVHLLTALAILLISVPANWFQHFVPGLSLVGWIFVCLVLCFFWLIFLSQDPRVAAVALFGLIGCCGLFAPTLIRYGLEFGLVLLLAHSVRWDDRSHRGAMLLRNLAGVLWLLFSSGWLREAPEHARLPVYVAAVALLLRHMVHMVVCRSSKPRAVPLYAAAVLGLEPESAFARDLTVASPGFVAIAASFLLFAAGTLAAFAKSKRRQSCVASSGGESPISDRS